MAVAGLKPSAPSPRSPLPMAAAMMQMTPMNGFPGPSGVQPSPTLLPVQAYRAGHQGSAAFAVGHAKRKEYHVLRVLGAGTKACVKLAKHNTSGQLVALKSIRKPALPRTGRRDSAKGFAGVTGSAGAPSSAAAAGSAVLGVAPSVDIAAASGSPSSALQPAVPNGAAVSGTINGSSGNGNSKPTMETEDYYIAEKEWKTEVSIMARVGHHENLPTLIDAFETNSKWYIAMTFCEGGDLLSRLLQIEHYSERHAASIMATICNAVHYLHSHGIAHRDLKPANLLMKDMSETSNLCIIDFNAGFIVQEPGIGAVNQAAAVIESGSFLLSKQSMQTVTGGYSESGKRNFRVVGYSRLPRSLPAHRHTFLPGPRNRSRQTVHDHGRHLVSRLHRLSTSHRRHPFPNCNVLRTALRQNPRRGIFFPRRYPPLTSRKGLCSKPSCFGSG